MTTDSTGTIAEAERYDPWGKTRAGNITSTEKGYTGQRYDTGTGLLFYNARYYDASLARFVSADSIVPGMEDGKSGSAASLGYDDQQALRPLTVDFHEGGFLSTYGQELRFTAQKGFHFHLSDDDRKHEKYQWGPQNAQALNRYAYVLNNPLRYVDPSGHWPLIAHAGEYSNADAGALINDLGDSLTIIGLIVAALPKNIPAKILAAIITEVLAEILVIKGAINKMLAASKGGSLKLYLFQDQLWIEAYDPTGAWVGTYVQPFFNPITYLILKHYMDKWDPTAGPVWVTI